MDQDDNLKAHQQALDMYYNNVVLNQPMFKDYIMQLLHVQ